MPGSLLHTISQNKTSAVVIMFLVTLLVRLQTFFHPIYNGDEANYAAHALILLDGGLPYVDFVEKKPPFIFLFYALSFKIFGVSLEVVHFLTALWIFVTAFFIYKILEYFAGRFHGLMGGILYALFSSCLVETEVFATNCEILMVLPLVASSYYLLVGLDQKKYGLVLLSGMLSCFGFLFKHQAAIHLPTTLAFIFLTWLKDSSKAESFIKSLKLSSSFFIGFLLPIISLSLFYQAHGHLSELYEWNILKNLDYLSNKMPAATSFKAGFINTGGFILSNLILFYAVWHVLKNPRESIQKREKLVSFATLWFFLSLIPIATGGRFYGHYYIQLYPPLVIIATFWIASFINNLPSFRRITQYSILGLLILPTSFFQIMAAYRTEKGLFEGAWPIHQKMVSVIQEYSSDEDRIFVWGNYAHPYYFAKRRPAARFVTCEYVIPYWEKYFAHRTDFQFSEMTSDNRAQLNLLMDDLSETRPALIIDTSSSPHFQNFTAFQIKAMPPLSELISTHYQLVSNVGEVAVYQLKLKKNPPPRGDGPF